MEAKTQEREHGVMDATRYTLSNTASAASRLSAMVIVGDCNFLNSFVVFIFSYSFVVNNTK